jgi:glycosyltransferase involved in cell wall biosynthesis
VALIANLCPNYRHPLFELLEKEFDTTFYFFSAGNERYRGELLHEPGDLSVREPRQITIAGHPLMIGLERELRRGRFDVIVKCINGRLMLPYVYTLAKRKDIPFVLWTGIWHHPQTVSHRVTRPFVERIYRGADAIVTYGDHVNDFLQAVPGVTPEKAYVAGQAIDPAPFRVVKPEFKAPAVILFVGQLEDHKGIRDLLGAFNAVEDQNARLRLAGAGSLEREVRVRASTDSRVEILGHVQHAALPAELASARCLALPAVTTDRYRECWGLVVNEAMAAGIPVITSDAVGAAAGGLVRNGRNGFVVPEGNQESLAAAMRRLIADPSLAESMGTQARIDVSKFDYRRMVHAFVDAIDHAVAVRNRGADASSGTNSAANPDRA